MTRIDKAHAFLRECGVGENAAAWLLTLLEDELDIQYDRRQEGGKGMPPGVECAIEALRQATMRILIES